jgi:hypothetical protein
MQDKEESEIQMSENEKGKEQERLIETNRRWMKNEKKNSERERETVARIEKTLRAI